MSGTLNVRAKTFIRRELFMGEPDEGFAAASRSLAVLASSFCEYDDCDRFDPDRRYACRKHARATVLGASKMVVEGDLFAELSSRGVVFVRLSPQGVLAPLGWGSVPGWLSERPALVEWARGQVAAARWEAGV